MRARLPGVIRTAKIRALPAVLAVLLIAGGGQPAPRTVLAAADGPPVVLPRIDCADMTGQDLSGTPGALAVIGSAAPATSPDGSAACEVKGTVAPQIQFDVFLPTKTWRQRYLQLGCASFCGTIDFYADATDGCVPLTRGDFVLATNDEGHSGVSGSDATFGADPQLRVDFGYRADHVVALVAKRLIALYYGQGPRYSYFDGCSQGGHEGLTEAQRYPHDFDGIVAGAPASLFTSLVVWSTGWHAAANTDAHGRPILTAAKLPALHAAVLRECDVRDGLADGQIDDPRACEFDPRSLRCATGSDTPDCLTNAQIGAVRKLYDGPRDERGRRMYPGGEPVGSEANWARWIDPAVAGATATNALKYLAYPSARPSATLSDLHFDSATFREIYQRAGIYDASDPDLTAFRAAGGKLLLWHGWADPAISPYGTIAYYHALTERMAGRTPRNGSPACSCCRASPIAAEVKDRTRSTRSPPPSPGWRTASHRPGSSPRSARTTTRSCGPGRSTPIRPSPATTGAAARRRGELRTGTTAHALPGRHRLAGVLPLRLRTDLRLARRPLDLHPS